MHNFARCTILHQFQMRQFCPDVHHINYASVVAQYQRSRTRMKLSNSTEAPQRRKKPILARAKGFFQTGESSWSSELAAATIIYRPNTNTIVFIKRWGQKPKTIAGASWAYPYFPPASVERMTAYARDVYYGVHHGGQNAERGKLRNHRTADCERCEKLGRPCQNN
jgi:hypothetical protein